MATVVQATRHVTNQAAATTSTSPRLPDNVGGGSDDDKCATFRPTGPPTSCSRGRRQARGVSGVRSFPPTGPSVRPSVRILHTPTHATAAGANSTLFLLHVCSGFDTMCRSRRRADTLRLFGTMEDERSSGWSA